MGDVAHDDRYISIVPYENLKVTTMTIIMTLSGGVYTETAFHLLPITRIAIPQARQSSKCKLPHCEIPGAILSMRCRRNVRGIIRNKSSPFKNAVTIDISTKKKNISVKLSSYSIQMCGASSREDGIEAATHILNHLHVVQNVLNKMQADPIKMRSTIDWVKQITRGEGVEKPSSYIIEGPKMNLRVYRMIPDSLILKPQNMVPDDIDPDIVRFLLTLADDFIYHGDYCRKLDYIPNIQSIIDDPLELVTVSEAMVNYNYSLGFEVDRSALDQYIDGRNGFASRYNNALATSVTIELPYEPLAGTAIKRRKNKVPHHTFLVYKSGAVTQSGPGGELMREAYYLFMETMAQLEPYVRYNQ